MFSKTTELAGFSVIAIAISYWYRWEAGLLFIGLALLFIGSNMDDKALGQKFRRGFAWARYFWHRQLLRESGFKFPSLRAPNTPKGLVPCTCGADPGCPLCDGVGYVPDPELRPNPKSPHPPIKVDPEAEAFWSNIARIRERDKVSNGSR